MQRHRELVAEEEENVGHGPSGSEAKMREPPASPLGPEDDVAKEEDAVFVTGRVAVRLGERSAFLSHHTSQAMLKGWAATLQAARRAVLAALVQSCGCAGLCSAEDGALPVERNPKATAPFIGRVAGRQARGRAGSEEQEGWGCPTPPCVSICTERRLCFWSSNSVRLARRWP